MTKEQEERLVSAWEGLTKSIGDLNEIARTALSKQWPEPREPREAVVTRKQTEEDKLKIETGNTDGPVEDWLSEFDDEQGEIGPREKAWRESHGEAGQSKRPSRPKAPSKA